MKTKRMLLLSLVIIIAGVVAGRVSAESDIEKFLMNFNGEYGLIKDNMDGSPFDSKNPYVKSVKQMVTTESGISVMLDKVLVTEDSLTAAFLISGDLPENLDDVQLQITKVDVGPLLPYPEDSFKLIKGGGGDGGPKLLIANEDPLVLYDFTWAPLLRYEGVSPADPMQVKITVPVVSIGWRYQDDSQEHESTDYYYEELNHTFEFETDGAELAALTRNYDLNHAIKVGSREYSFDKLRFNPMHLILFSTDLTGAGFPYSTKESPEDLQYKAITDDKTEIILHENSYPYGYTRKIINPETIQVLEKTKTLTLVPCFLRKPLAEYDEYPQFDNPDDYDCSPERAFIVQIK